jgi:hypothetical protein
MAGAGAPSEPVAMVGRAEKMGVVRQPVGVRGAIWRPNEADVRDVQAGRRAVVTVQPRRLDQGLEASVLAEAELVRGRP